MSRLKAALDPKSVAVIGASENPNKVGGRPVHYLDKFGFKGRIFPVNPSRSEIQGYKCYKSLADLPEAPEMVIVAVAGDNAIGAVDDCAAHGVKIAVVMASGFGEVDAVAGKAKERRMVEVAHKAGMRIVGPNSQGLANFGTGAIASFSTMFMDMDEPRAMSRCSARAVRSRRCRWVFCASAASASATPARRATTPTFPSVNSRSPSPRIPK